MLMGYDWLFVAYYLLLTNDWLFITCIFFLASWGALLAKVLGAFGLLTLYTSFSSYCSSSISFSSFFCGEVSARLFVCVTNSVYNL